MSTAIAPIPLLDTRPEIESIWQELMPAIEEVVRKGQFIMGPNVKAFETEAAEYLGVQHAVALNSGTDALVLGARALGLRPGDEVITTPFTFFATAEAISHYGAVPVLADIDPRTFNFDLDQVRAKITANTKAIFPVHLYGQPVNMQELMAIAQEHELKVLEDTAQAFGASTGGRKAGTWGQAGAFSFFPSKNLGGFGDGGMLVTNDAEIADKVRMLRVHGARKKYVNEEVGVNSRLDEIQAAVLRIKLRRIDEWNQLRREVAARYDELLADIPGVLVPRRDDHCDHVFHQYTIRVLDGKRDELQRRLADEGIATFVYYPIPIHQLPAYANLEFGPLPNADQCSAEVLSLPIWPYMRRSDQERVASVIRNVLSN